MLVVSEHIVDDLFRESGETHELGVETHTSQRPAEQD